jgi:uncharacterized protein with FMN-binding domain
MSETPKRRVWVAVGAVVLAGGVTAWVAGCRTPAEMDTTRLRDGSYEGTSFKFPGPMAIDLKVEKGKIAAIDVKRHVGAQRYLDALKPLIQAMIDKQSLAVDDVTGATVSSRALKRAVADAVSKAAEPVPGN